MRINPSGMVSSLKQARPASILYQMVWQSFDWLYPPACAGCGKPYTRFCQYCREMVGSIEEPICSLCGMKLISTGICPECSRNPPSYRSLRSCASYEGPLRRALHRLKYQGDISLGERLAQPMIEKLKQLKWHVDLVVPVPGSLARQKIRGYNQASLLALPIALSLGIPYRPSALIKVRDIRSQVGLSASERRQNVRDAYQAVGGKVANRTILVVDDIRTSGATVEACARTLMEHNARQVYGLTLAQAVFVIP